MKKIGTLWRQGLVYPYQSSNLLSLLLLVVMLIAGGNISWAQTETIQAGSTTSGAAFSYSELAAYSYNDSHWAKKNNSTVIKLDNNSNFTFTNVNGVTITGITVKGVAQDNSAQSSTVTITDDASTPNSINTGTVSWKGRQVTEPTSSELSGVNALKMTAGTVYTVSNSGYNLGIQIEITYTAGSAKKEVTRFSPVGGQQTIITTGITKGYSLYFGGPGCTERPNVSSFTAIVDNSNATTGGISVSSTSKLDNENTLWTITVPVTTVSAGNSRVTLNFAGDENYQPKTGSIDITIGTPYTVNFSSNNVAQGTVAAVTDKKVVGVNTSTGAFSSGASIPSGQNATFTATPATGYLFDNWHDGATGHNENPYTVTVNSDLTLTANFIESRTINVALATGCEGMGSVALYAQDTATPNLSGVEIKKNVKLDFTATANTGYKFLGWKTSADGSGAYVSENAKFTQKAESYTTGTTLYAYFELIPDDPTKVGADDNTTAYGAAKSNIYSLANGKTRHVSFVNHSSKAENWTNWLLWVGENNTFDTDADATILRMRADNYDDLTDNSEKISTFNWSTFKEDMDGANVDMYITNSGNHIYVNATITKNATTYKYSMITKDRTHNNVYFCFTVNLSHITDLNVGDEATAYELSYGLQKQGETGDDHTECGTVNITNLEGLPLRKGTFVREGETVKYAAVTNPGYLFTGWTSGNKDAERDITVSGSAIAEGLVIPRAVFAVNFVITTNPESASYNYNTSVTALTVATNAPASNTYQWYKNTTDDNTSGTPISDATNASYTPSSTVAGTTYYYCVITDPVFGSVTSATAKIDIIVPKPSIKTQENIVIINGVAGANCYYTLDSSDPTSSATRIEYTDEVGKTTAIHNNVHLRAVACIDGVYSAIQGTDLTYERVTVLEARGSAVAVHGEFTNSTCTSSISFTNTTYTPSNIISPNSIISKETKAYRAGSSNTATIELRSTAAYKIVIGAYSGASTERELTGISVNGSPLIKGTDYDISGSYGGKLRQNYTDRIVIKLKKTIEQGSDVTFDFTGNNSCICYYEIYGDSKEVFCDEPEIIPTDFVDGVWSYTLKPVSGTNMKYVVVNTKTGSVLSNYPKSSATDVTISKTTEPNLNQEPGYMMIRAWSEDPSGTKAASHRVFTYVESELTPVVKFNVKDNTATFNKATSQWDPAEPELVIYPTSIDFTGVTYESDDATVGYGTDGTKTINKGSGQGVCRITATIVIADNTGGLKPGTYKGVLTLGVVDGYPNMLKSGQKPLVGESVEIKDNSGNKILTLNYGGWTHNPDEGNAWQTNNGKRADDWPKAGTYDGTPIDGYENQSQMNNDARSEIGWSGSVVWEGTGYTKVHPFSLPCRGAYITIVPEHNGVLTIYLVQNGCINTDTKTHKATSISSGPRTYYWFDQSGNVIMPSSVTTKQKILTGYNEGVFAEGQPDNRGGLQNWLNNSELKSLVTTYWRETVNTETDPVETAVKYQNGHLVFEKAYVKYVVNLCAGNTYYFFSNASKMGYAGLNFKPTDNINVLEMDGTSVAESVGTITEQKILDPTTEFFAPSTTNAYNEVLVDRSFAANTWNTICLPFAVSEAQVREIFGEGTQLVIYDGMDNKTAKFLYHVYQDILPGQAYLIRPTKSVAKGSLIFHNVTISKDVTVHNNGYTGSDIFDFIGTFDPVTLKAYDHIVSSDGKIGYSTKSISMPGYRAYLRNNTSDTPNPAKIAAISLLNAFDDLDEDPSVAEIMQVLMDDGVEFAPVDGVYNISGQKVADSTAGLPKGMYIVNGKKVFVR